MNNRLKHFKFRNFISITLFFLFIIVIFCAVALFFRPEGSIARWTSWTFLGLPKNIWEGLHTIFSMLFIIFALIHFCFNLKSFMRFIKNKINKGLNLRSEFILSFTMICILLIISLMQWQPVWEICKWRAFLKKGNHIIYTKPPETDFDLKKLQEIAQSLHMSNEDLLNNLRQNDFVVENINSTLLDIAIENKTSPENIYSNIIDREL